TWGADVADFPRLHTGWDRLLAHTNAPVWTLDAVPEGPGVETISASGWHAVPGAVDADSRGVVGRLTDLLAEGIRVVVVADGEGSVDRLSQRLLESGIEVATAVSDTGPLAGGAHLVVAPLERGFVLASSGLAVVTEAEITGRRRTRRRTKPRRTAAVRVFEDLSPGDHVVHEHHGVARFAGLVTRTLGGVERDYL
ncbi:MAG TPA: CarD family transcriptional regulator, partial [Acidimicrobiales bacterium]|nr:CarD family transcriptional regulator [Acidimicrobiales bacterium]